jgi:hypothetical protein
MIAFGLHLFVLKIHLKMALKKQNIKEIRYKKKKEGKTPSAQPPGLPSRGPLSSPHAWPS